MSYHRLNPRVVATLLAALCLALCAAPAAFASGDSGDTLAGYRFASPDRAMQSPGGSVRGLRVIPDAHATVKPDVQLSGPKASRDTGANVAAGLAVVAIMLALVAPFLVFPRVRRGGRAVAPAPVR